MRTELQLDVMALRKLRGDGNIQSLGVPLSLSFEIPLSVRDEKDDKIE